jgi:5-methylcytosine-specific restriction protein A
LEIIYTTSEEVFQRRISLEEGIGILTEQTQMPYGSAKIILRQVYPGLRSGKIFTRTLSAGLFDFLLKNIQNDFGNEALLISLNGFQLHITYRLNQGYPTTKVGNVLYRYHHELGFALDNTTDEIEQEELIAKINKELNKQQIINKLKAINQYEPEIIFFSGKAYKRDNRTIALIKIVREHKCQICETTIIKKDGSQYVEAAHIISKHEKGPETPDNIILLCPNHHKEFDLGDLVILKHNSIEIKFKLNGKKYNINLGF